MKEDLRVYRCHKVVHAGKIMGFAGVKDDNTKIIIILQGVNGEVLWPVPTKWMDKHDPKVSGYIVFYADDYMSYSPSAAFEGGYNVIGG